MKKGDLVFIHYFGYFGIYKLNRLSDSKYYWVYDSKYRKKLTIPRNRDTFICKITPLIASLYGVKYRD